MSLKKKTRRALSLGDKIKIINKLESGSFNTDICKEYGLPKSTVSTIWANRHKIQQAGSSKNIAKLKRLRDPIRKDVDKALLTWFGHQRSLNIPISGEILRHKAEALAKCVKTPDSDINEPGSSSADKNEDFTCSRGWLDRFKKRYDINSGKMHGESANVDKNVPASWLKDVWPGLRRRYSEENIFNGDETGLFYKLIPDRTLKFRKEKCSGGKLSKERLTIFVCANMDGTEKRTLLVVGKSKSPRCLKNVCNLPVKYEANKKAWMTSDLFESELRKWDKELTNKNRRILLLVDNCTAHPAVKNLRSIELIFLPPNVTSIMQPMDQGVIKSLKVNYRKLLIVRLISDMEQNRNFKITLLDAINMIDSAWKRVTSRTIKNCFKHGGFYDTQEEFEPEDELPLSEYILLHLEDDEEDDVPLSVWAQRQNITEFQNLNYYEEIDEELATNASPADSELMISSIGNEESDQETDMEAIEEIDRDPEIEKPKITEVLESLRTIERFMLCTNHVSNNFQSALEVLKKETEKQFLFQRKEKQSRITDFFT